MKAMYTGGVCLAGVLALNMAAFAQATPAQEKNTPPTRTTGAQAAAGQITVTGCIEREADYRRATDAGKGGAAGSGLGTGNEFVLSHASMGSGSAAGAASPTGTTGAAGMTYELTGAMEGQAAQHVGKRVEISGKLKAAETTASGRPTGGATAGRPPEGVDVLSKDLKLRELEVASIRQVAGMCPAH